MAETLYYYCETDRIGVPISSARCPECGRRFQPRGLERLTMREVEERRAADLLAEEQKTKESETGELFCPVCRRRYPLGTSACVNPDCGGMPLQFYIEETNEEAEGQTEDRSSGKEKQTRQAAQGPLGGEDIHEIRQMGEQKAGEVIDAPKWKFSIRRYLKNTPVEGKSFLVNNTVLHLCRSYLREKGFTGDGRAVEQLLQRISRKDAVLVQKNEKLFLMYDPEADGDVGVRKGIVTVNGRRLEPGDVLQIGLDDQIVIGAVPGRMLDCCVELTVEQNLPALAFSDGAEEIKEMLQDIHEDSRKVLQNNKQLMQGQEQLFTNQENILEGQRTGVQEIKDQVQETKEIVIKTSEQMKEMLNGLKERIDSGALQYEEDIVDELENVRSGMKRENVLDDESNLELYLEAYKDLESFDKDQFVASLSEKQKEYLYEAAMVENLLHEAIYSGTETRMACASALIYLTMLVEDFFANELYAIADHIYRSENAKSPTETAQRFFDKKKEIDDKRKKKDFVSMNDYLNLFRVCTDKKTKKPVFYNKWVKKATKAHPVGKMPENDFRHALSACVRAKGYRNGISHAQVYATDKRKMKWLSREDYLQQKKDIITSGFIPLLRDYAEYFRK